MHTATGNTQEEEREAAYLHNRVQNHLLSLVFAVAQVAVCVNVVGVAVQFNMHVVETRVFILDCEGDLCGGSSEVHGAHGFGALGPYVGIPQVFLQNIQSCMLEKKVWLHFEPKRLVKVVCLQEVSHQVVDSDPAVQSFLLTADDGGVFEIEWQRVQVVFETPHDLIGPLFISHTNEEKVRPKSKA